MQRSQMQLSYHSLLREVLAQLSMCKERFWMAAQSPGKSSACSGPMTHPSPPILLLRYKHRLVVSLRSVTATVACVMRSG